MTKNDYVDSYTEELANYIEELLSKALKQVDSYLSFKDLEEALLSIVDVCIDLFTDLLDNTKPEDYQIAYLADIEESKGALEEEFKARGLTL